MNNRPHRPEQQTPDNVAKATARIEKARKDGNTNLELNELGLTELPEAIGQLTQLQGLSLTATS